MDQQSNGARGGGALALAALAALALLLAWTASGGVPDPSALAQEGATSTSTSTPGPPFTSPRSTPTFTATPRPAPIPHPIEFITNPTEAYVLSQRYFRNRGRGDAQEADASEARFDGEEAQPMHAPEARSLYLPLIRRDVGPLAWYKGAGQGIQYLQYSFVYSLGVTWWYDWQHDYAWFVTGRIAEPSYKPMVWCPHLPGEPGPTPDYYTDAQKGLWNPQELAAKARQYPGRTWLIFNEPDFPPSIHPGTPTPSYSYQQCGRVLCEMANYATLPAQATLPPNVTPTPTATWTPAPTLPPGTTATPLPTPVWPCSWPATTPLPNYYSQLRAKMIRIAADRYAQIYRIIKANDPTAKVFCCGNLDAGYSQWWADFLQQLRLYHSDVRIDGVAIHAYPWNTSVRNCWNYEPESEIWVRCMQPELEKNRNDFRSIGAPLALTRRSGLLRPAILAYRRRYRLP